MRAPAIVAGASICPIIELMLQSRSKIKFGFTLIELLVVISIIAILAAILFPVFAQAKMAAKKTAALSQMREVGVALTMYLGDWDDKYPQEHPTSSNPAVDDASGQLEGVDYGSPFDKLLPYVGSRTTIGAAIYNDPGDPDPHGNHLLDANGNCIGSSPLAPPPGTLTSDLLNAYFLFGATESQILEPSQTIYIAERRSSFCDVHFHPWLNEVQAPLSPQDKMNPIAISLRYNGGSNGVFADGHASWQTFEQARAPFSDHPDYGEYQAF